MTASADKYERFGVPLTDHLLTVLVHRCRRMWIALGNLETKSLRTQLADVRVDRPVYVTGLARSGTTILLEFLSRHRQAAFHRYRDFHGIFVPYWWQRNDVSQRRFEPEERAHGDGLKVTPDSPEAMEECLWMAFFDQLHNPHASNILDADSANPAFESFYRDHICKVLLARGRQRYVAKGNYNLSRLKYLLKIFPDARFVVAVRHPRSHVASSIKQHRLFCEGEARHPRALSYMRHVGHYEFGLDRRPIHVGDAKKTEQIIEFWNADQEVRGWARYWAMLYGWFAAQIESDTALRQAVELVRFEDLCAAPTSTLSRVLDHCELPDVDLLREFSARIEAPRYYEPSFTAEEEAIIREETADVARWFNYSEKQPHEPERLGIGDCSGMLAVN